MNNKRMMIVGPCILLSMSLIAAQANSQPVFQPEFEKITSGNQCSSGHVATPQEVRTYKTLACNALHEWDIVHFANGYSLSGSGYSCGLKDKDERTPTYFLCAKNKLIIEKRALPASPVELSADTLSDHLPRTTFPANVWIHCHGNPALYSPSMFADEFNEVYLFNQTSNAKLTDPTRCCSGKGGGTIPNTCTSGDPLRVYWNNVDIDVAHDYQIWERDLIGSDDHLYDIRSSTILEKIAECLKVNTGPECVVYAGQWYSFTVNIDYLFAKYEESNSINRVVIGVPYTDAEGYTISLRNGTGVIYEMSTASAMSTMLYTCLGYVGPSLAGGVPVDNPESADPIRGSVVTLDDPEAVGCFAYYYLKYNIPYITGMLFARGHVEPDAMTYLKLYKHCRKTSWSWSCDVPAVEDKTLFSGDCDCKGRLLQHKETGFFRCEKLSGNCGDVSFTETLGYEPNMNWYVEVH
jgi:hypothetical protein